MKHLKLREQVQQICTERGWQYDETQGDLGLFHKLLDGDWPDSAFLIVRPGQKVVATNDEQVIGAVRVYPRLRELTRSAPRHMQDPLELRSSAAAARYTCCRRRRCLPRSSAPAPGCR